MPRPRPKPGTRRWARIEEVCRERYGGAHDAHLAVNGECPWCGLYDPDAGGMSIDEAVRQWG